MNLLVSQQFNPMRIYNSCIIPSQGCEFKDYIFQLCAYKKHIEKIWQFVKEIVFHFMCRDLSLLNKPFSSILVQFMKIYVCQLYYCVTTIIM